MAIRHGRDSGSQHRAGSRTNRRKTRPVQGQHTVRGSSIMEGSSQRHLSESPPLSFLPCSACDPWVFIMNQPHLEPVPSPPHPCLAWGKACLCHQPDAHSSLDPLSKQLTSKVTTSSLSTRELNWYSTLSPEQTWLWPAFVLNKQQLIPSFALTCKGRRLHFAGSKV